MIILFCFICKKKNKVEIISKLEMESNQNTLNPVDMEKMRNHTGGREAEKHGDTILDGSVD